MLDILLLVEISWCTLILRTKGTVTLLLYVGGILTSGYAAAHISGWIASKFISPVSSAFLWLEGHLASDTQSVSTLSAFLPPMPTAGGFEHTQWIAMHVVRTLVSLSIITAIFTLFVVTDSLADAIWDQPKSTKPRISLLTTSISMVCGAYCAGLTVILFANLSWVQNFSGLNHELARSFIIHNAVKVIALIQGWMIQ